MSYLWIGEDSAEMFNIRSDQFFERTILWMKYEKYANLKLYMITIVSGVMDDMWIR